MKKQSLATWVFAGVLTTALIPAGYAQSQAPGSGAQQVKASTGQTSAPQPVNNAVCPVSGEPIGSMGEGVKVTHKGQVVTLCCKSCAEEFNANPDAYLQKARAGKKLTTPAQPKRPSKKADSKAKQQVSVRDVKNAHCPVSSKAIGSMGEGVPMVHNGYKVTLCCAGCKSRFEANPDQYVKVALADSKRP